jgi:hypothetical protein
MEAPFDMQISQVKLMFSATLPNEQHFRNRQCSGAEMCAHLLDLPNGRRKRASSVGPNQEHDK